VLQPAQLNLPLVVYLGNFCFAAVMSIGAGFWIPLALGLLLGVLPAVLCWRWAQSGSPRLDAVADLTDAAVEPIDDSIERIAA
jgi:uncharacterized membrane protein